MTFPHHVMWKYENTHFTVKHREYKFLNSYFHCISLHNIQIAEMILLQIQNIAYITASHTKLGQYSRNIAKYHYNLHIRSFYTT